jgi:hypothetical protein
MQAEDLCKVEFGRSNAYKVKNMKLEQKLKTEVLQLLHCPLIEHRPLHVRARPDLFCVYNPHPGVLREQRVLLYLTKVDYKKCCFVLTVSEEKIEHIFLVPIQLTCPELFQKKTLFEGVMSGDLLFVLDCHLYKGMPTCVFPIHIRTIFCWMFVSLFVQTCDKDRITVTSVLYFPMTRFEDYLKTNSNKMTADTKFMFLKDEMTAEETYWLEKFIWSPGQPFAVS